MHDLLKLGKDLMESYNHDNGKILKQETIKIITSKMIAKDKCPKKWDEYKMNWGLGMAVYKTDGCNSFGHNGSNYGYTMSFTCVPEKNKCIICMVNYNPKYENILGKEIKKILD